MVLFIEKTLKKNPELIECSMKYICEGIIRPDTYVIDVDTLVKNAESMLNEAKENNIKLYFMTKQIGRNPYISRLLTNLGYEGAVCVDYKEAQILIDNGIKIGHVGHLVQIPKMLIKDILMGDPDIITVFTYEKAKEISKIALQMGKTANIMLKIIDEKDLIYPSQEGGFLLDNLEDEAIKIMKLDNIKIKGITSFPCFLFNKEEKSVTATNNTLTLIKGKQKLNKIGINDLQVNMPSNTSFDTIKKIANLGGTHGEPGHSLTGTIPALETEEIKEKPAMVYASEISHCYKNSSYFYGGGYYRRSNIRQAIVGKNLIEMKTANIVDMDLESIDYYFEVEGCFPISTPVICSFRTQAFVTRSDIALVEGLSTGKPNLVGIYNSLGDCITK